MDRIWKRFFYKLRLPFYSFVAIVTAGLGAGWIAEQFGSSLTEAFAYAVYYAVLIGFTVVPVIVLVAILLKDLYDQSRREIQRENKTVMDALKND